MNRSLKDIGNSILLLVVYTSFHEVSAFKLSGIPAEIAQYGGHVPAIGNIEPDELPRPIPRIPVKRLNALRLLLEGLERQHNLYDENEPNDALMTVPVLSDSQFEEEDGLTQLIRRLKKRLRRVKPKASKTESRKMRRLLRNLQRGNSKQKIRRNQPFDNSDDSEIADQIQPTVRKSSRNCRKKKSTIKAIPSELPSEVIDDSENAEETLVPMQDVFAGTFGSFGEPIYQDALETDTMKSHGFGAIDPDSPPGFGEIFPANPQEETGSDPSWWQDPNWGIQPLPIDELGYVPDEESTAEVLDLNDDDADSRDDDGC